ncbi:Sphingosine-1-phosphate lyase [Zancudomyces culisetae]|uniref:sphinganine-1-phosphate aldolase n=1 Tax=Zancudomyces culisetae TaxID=1213189 RepID=A0A1R1PDK1_ZANCU|nr:Sphingosine-1-phosphate lyase [Zancudomyces culisetae]|eukprot:OMH79064.1 Sphingosine-1-phosphate lyase [Zancudomyces culisetae]
MKVDNNAKSFLVKFIRSRFVDRAILLVRFLTFLRFLSIVFKISRNIYVYGLTESLNLIYKDIQTRAFGLLKSSPAVKKKIDDQVEKAISDIRRGFLEKEGNSDTSELLELPEEGYNDEEIVNVLNARWGEGNIDWKGGKASGAVYCGIDTVLNVSNKAMEIFNVSNPLHPALFPGLRQIEAEIISMTLKMFNAPETACGTTTSGGTESIIMSVRAHLNYAKKQRTILKPNLIIPTTAHVAFDKACEYFGIELVTIPVDPKSGKVFIESVRRAINRDTIMIVGSAINFPHGVMDDIQALGQLAKSNGIGMHVDCCLGSFLMPFMCEAGFQIPTFDFRVSGVTAISCDTHKYGFAPKGSSVIMYVNNELRHSQYFVSTRWPGGIYASPSVAGSRPGSIIAGCWASMVKMGRQGYINSCRDIVNTRIKIQRAIEQMEGLYVIGEPICSVIAFSSHAPINIYSILDAMSKRSWSLSALQYPPGLHLACTNFTTKAADKFITDLQDSINEIKANPDMYIHGSSALYGAAVALPDKAPIERIALGFIDSLFATK